MPETIKMGAGAVSIVRTTLLAWFNIFINIFVIHVNTVVQFKRLAWPLTLLIIALCHKYKVTSCIS